jgi:hypothetical protein
MGRRGGGLAALSALVAGLIATGSARLGGDGAASNECLRFEVL